MGSSASLRQTLSALSDLVHAGKIRYVGTSTFLPSQLVEAQYVARERGLVRPGVRLSDEVVAEVLLEHAVITPADLTRLDDPAWCTRQEDLWWTRER